MFYILGESVSHEIKINLSWVAKVYSIILFIGYINLPKISEYSLKTYISKANKFFLNFVVYSIVYTWHEKMKIRLFAVF